MEISPGSLYAYFSHISVAAVKHSGRKENSLSDQVAPMTILPLWQRTVNIVSTEFVLVNRRSTGPLASSKSYFVSCRVDTTSNNFMKKPLLSVCVYV